MIKQVRTNYLLEGAFQLFLTQFVPDTLSDIRMHPHVNLDRYVCGE